jgi:gamma-D-glutamyl-L-lysine dipeptidyl-peptidase
MKKLSIAVFLLITGLCHVQARVIDSLLISRLKELVIQVQREYAPDKRTERFLVDVEAGADVLLTVETTNAKALQEFKTLLNRERIDVKIVEQVFPSKELNGKVYGVANLSVCNNRTSPDHAAEMATQTLLGTPVDILKKERGYYLVRTPDRYLSWIEGAAITPMDQAEFKNWQSARKVVFTVDYGHSYQTSSKKSLPVSDLVAGNILRLLGKEKKYYKVAFPDGRIAYVKVKDVALYDKWLIRPDPTSEAIINTAKSLLGVPYLWGGTSIKGVDCSGFTKMCFYLNGISIPRDASQQALVGHNIDIFEGDTVNFDKCLKNLKPGDLLFFSAGKDKRPNPRVTHTAIYIGEGEFIQSAGLVRINSMMPDSENYDDYQSRTLVSAKRILTAINSPEVSRIELLPYYIML